MPDFSRRQFFKTLIAGAVATAVLRSYEPDKYDRALKSARSIAWHTKAYRKSREQEGWDARLASNDLLMGVQSEAQNLFTIFNEEFACVHSVEVKEGIRDILEGRRPYDGLIYDHENERIARSILESVFVIAVGRDLVRYEQAPLITKRIPAFETFASNYKSFLVQEETA